MASTVRLLFIVVIFVFTPITGIAASSPPTQQELSRALNLMGVSDTEIRLNVPISIPASANPHAGGGENTLMATVILPADRREQKIPTILMTTAYRHELMPVLGGKLVDHGYALVTVDCRGTGSSATGWELLDLVEQYDLAYIVDHWIPSQEWSDGDVGMYGPSYIGITQLLTAGLVECDADGHPLHLKAIMPHTTMSDTYRDVAGHGGNIDVLFLSFWMFFTDFLAILPPLQLLPGPGWEPWDAFDVWAGHILHTAALVGYVLDPAQQYDNDWYDRKSPMLYWPVKPPGGWQIPEGQRVTPRNLPIFLSGGWFDIFTTGTLDNYTYGLRDHAVEDKALIMGEWYHTGASFCDGLPCIGECELAARWFDWKIKGEEDRFMCEFPVILKVMGVDLWRAEKDWPLPASRLEERTLHLSKAPAEPIDYDWYTNDRGNPCLSLVETPDEDDYTGENPVMIHSFHPDYRHGAGSRSKVRWSAGSSDMLSGGGGPGDEEDERDDEKGVPTFTTAPLKEDLEIVGPLKLTFWARTLFEGPPFFWRPGLLNLIINSAYGLSSNLFEEQMEERTVQWVVELNDVFPDGRARNITSGWLRASRRPCDPADATKADTTYEILAPFYTLPGPNPIEEGIIYEYVVAVWPTCNIFEAGHRVRLSISGSDFPHLIPVLTPSTNELIIDDEHPARLDFTTTNQENEGVDWKWIGDDEEFDAYLMSHVDEVAVDAAGDETTAEDGTTATAADDDDDRCFISACGF